MASAIVATVAKASHQLRALLRLRRFYSRSEMVSFYKSQVLCFIEYATPAVYHAHRFLLESLDRLQDTFLEAMDLTPEAALHDFHLAPLCCRRDIAMLGLIHRVVLGVAPPQFNKYIGPSTAAWAFRNMRSPELRHNRQLHDPIDGSQSRAVRESVLGLIYVYNALPQRVVDAKSAPSFQKMLQSGLRNHTAATGWQHLFFTGFKTMPVRMFQSLFTARW